MTDDARIANARDRLAELRHGFAARLRERLAELEGAVDAAQSGRGEAVAKVEHLAHKLAGTAGSYGFHDVGAIAAELEALCSTGYEAKQASSVLERLRRAAA